jgi:protein tyrosine/serine phosphatase
MIRFITMLSGMQSLVDLGVCREMPVVGFINGVLILGIIVRSACLAGSFEAEAAGRNHSSVTQRQRRRRRRYPVKYDPDFLDCLLLTDQTSATETRTHAQGQDLRLEDEGKWDPAPRERYHRRPTSGHALQRAV